MEVTKSKVIRAERSSRKKMKVKTLFEKKTSHSHAKKLIKTTV